MSRDGETGPHSPVTVPVFAARRRPPRRFSLRNPFTVPRVVALAVSLAAPVATPASEDAPEAKYTAIPGIKISPEIGIGFGAMVVHPASPRPGSRMEYRMIYTTRNQSEVRVTNRTADFLGSRWEARFDGSFQYFPDSYFGGGNAPADSNEIEYSPLGGYASASFTRPLLPGHDALRFYAGARTEAWKITGASRVDGRPGAADVLGPHVTGHDGGVADLWETGLEYDTRDNQDVPARGLHVVQRLGTTLAGEFDFRSSETWFTAHETLGRHWEIAGKLWQRTLSGTAPFFMQPDLGNEDRLRGVPHKRFRDNSAQLAQAEIRFGFPLRLPIIASWLGKDWQIAAFGETGRVGRTFADASRASLNHAAGVGGRLIFNDRVGCMRGDLGFSEHGVALIIKFNQAF